MKSFTVNLAAVTDLHMTVEMEAATAEQAVELALQESSDDPDWRLGDDGADPIHGTVEVVEVAADGETVEEFALTGGVDYSRAGDNADLLREAVDAWPAFDTDEPVDGGDLVQWFAAWRLRAKQSLGIAAAATPAAG